MSRYPSKPPSEGRGKAKPSRGEAIFIIYRHDDPKPSAGQRLTDLLVMIMFMTMDKMYIVPPLLTIVKKLALTTIMIIVFLIIVFIIITSILTVAIVNKLALRDGLHQEWFHRDRLLVKGFLFKIVHVKKALAKLNDEFTLPWWFIIRGFGSASSFSSCPSSLRIGLS